MSWPVKPRPVKEAEEEEKMSKLKPFVVLASLKRVRNETAVSKRTWNILCQVSTQRPNVNVVTFHELKSKELQQHFRITMNEQLR